MENLLSALTIAAGKFILIFAMSIFFVLFDNLKSTLLLQRTLPQRITGFYSNFSSDTVSQRKAR